VTERIQNKGKSNTFITAYRGIMMVAIALFHTGATYSFPFYRILHLAYDYGGVIGNRFFFMSSGFLFVCIHKEQIIENKLKLIPYLLAKVKKYYPIYILSNGIVLVNSILRNGFTNSVSLKQFVPILLMIPEGWFFSVTPYNFPCWFISVLLLQYIVCYGIIKIGGRSEWKLVLMSLILIMIGELLLDAGMSLPFLFRLNGEGLASFFYGVITYLLFEKCKVLNESSFRGNLFTLGIAFLFLLILLVKSNFGVCSDCLTTFTCVLLIVIGSEVPFVNRFLSCSFFQLLGKMSTFIFFFHIPIVFFWRFVEKKVEIIRQMSEGVRYLFYWVVIFASYYVYSSLMNQNMNYRLKLLSKNK